jgi:hypothetical protein
MVKDVDVGTVQHVIVLDNMDTMVQVPLERTTLAEELNPLPDIVSRAPA